MGTEGDTWCMLLTAVWYVLAMWCTKIPFCLESTIVNLDLKIDYKLVGDKFHLV